MEKKEKKYNDFNGGVTEAQIAQWKAQNRKMYEITVTDGDDRFTGYFKRPGQEALTAANKMVQSDPVKAGTVIFDNCWLGGAPEMKSDFLVKLAAIQQLDGIVASCSAEIKNL